MDALDQGGLDKLSFSQTEPPLMTLDAINPDISQDATSVSDGEVKTLSNKEVEELNKLEVSHDFQLAASVLEAVGSGLSLIPQIKAQRTTAGRGRDCRFWRSPASLHGFRSGIRIAGAGGRVYV